MEIDLGKITLIIGSTNFILSLEVAILTNILEVDGIWSIPYTITFLFSIISNVQMFLVAIFGMVSIRRENSPRILVPILGIILGSLGSFILGASNIKLVVF